MRILHIGPVKNNNKQNVNNSFSKLEIADGLGSDGPSRSILGLLDGLSKERVDVGLLSTKDYNYKSNNLPKGVKYLKPYTGQKYRFNIDTKKWVDYIEQDFGIPDIVNFHDVYDLFSVRIAQEIVSRGWKYLVTPRGGLRQVAQKRDWYKKIIANYLFFNRYLEYASFIMALTKEEAGDIRLFNKNLKRVIIVPNGLRKDIYDPKTFEKIHYAKSDKLTFGFIGALFPFIKGIDLLIDAIILYQKNYGDNLKFIFIGPKKTKKDQRLISKKLKNLKFDKSVEFKGPMFDENKWTELSKFDIFVLPSRTEGMPIVALEAMAFGKPCLFTTGTNMVDFILEAKGGWGAELDSKSIYNNLVKISKIPKDELEKMGQNARKYFLDNFTWGIVTDIYLTKVKNELNR